MLAAHAIETPRILLNSKSEATPNGAANSSDQVGRNLMDHPTQLSWAFANDPVWPYRGPLATSGIENLRDGDFRKDRGAFRIEIGNDGWSWPTGAPISTAQDLANQGATRQRRSNNALAYQSARHIRLASLVEQPPDPDNRVTLDDATFDVYGVGVPKIAYRIDDYTKAGFAASVTAHDEIFAKVGTTGVIHSPDAQGAGHIIGTARMGEDPKTSVVDADLRSHDHPNLFILGSTVFPTSATGNPTLTIAALTHPGRGGREGDDRGIAVDPGRLPADEDVAARLVAVVAVLGVHRPEQRRRLDPDRRILVAGDIEDQETVGVGVVGGERRDMAAGFLADRLPEVVDQDEMLIVADRRHRRLAEGIDARIGGVMDIDRRGRGRRGRRRAGRASCRMAGSRIAAAGCHRLSGRGEDVLLIEQTEPERQVRGRARHVQRVEDHRDRSRAAVGRVDLVGEVAG